MFLRLKPTVLTALFSIFSFLAFSREPLPKTLLWRISGHGLQKPSYLYGTFHMNDKRLFQFTDSVYRSIESSQGLAIEVNPDEMAAYYVNKLFDDLGKGKKLKDLLPDKDYEKYSNALSKKLKKPADKITSNDILKEKNKWMADYFDKGEMPTFMDAYLYNIGRRQGKWLGGIEDLSDQTGLMEDLIDQSDIAALLHTEKGEVDETLEKMIRLYTAQDIEGIDAFTNESSSERQKDLLLIRRNIKMARRMDSLANVRTMFFAVGAAHLPGDSGVIQLLKNKGFHVEPVLSTNKIDPDKYTFKEVPIPWQSVTDDKNQYTASMPGNPANISLYGVVNLKFLLDLYGFRGYCTMATVMPANIKNYDSMFTNMAKSMYKNAKNVVVNKLSKDGVPGKEFIYTVDNNTNRVQMFFANNTVYLAYVSSMKKASVNDENSDKFFASFSIVKNAPAANSQMKAFSDPIIGISLNTPVELAYNKELSKGVEGWKIKAYSGIDMSSGSYVFLVSKDVLEGRYIPNDSIIFNDLNTYYKSIYKNVTDREVLINGTNFHEIIGTENKEKSPLDMRVLATVKNNRNIILSVIGDKSTINSKTVDSIFNSVHVEIKSSMQWNTQMGEDSSFSVWAPQPLKYIPSEVRDTKHIVFYDSTTSTSYMILTDTLSKYRWYSSDSSFWSKAIQLSNNADSTISDTQLNTPYGEAKELIIQLKSNNIYSRTRMFVNGNILYKLYCVGAKELLSEHDTKQFFESFKLLKPSGNHFITEPKTPLILGDINNADSATRVDAYHAIDEAPFSKNDFESLHKALFNNYMPLWDGGDSLNVNRRISRKLQVLTDTSAVPFIEKEYASLKSTLQPIALNTLAGINTQTSYTTLANLLDKSAGLKGFESNFIVNLKDSLALTNGIYKHFLPFAKDSANAPSVAALLSTLIDSGFIKTSDISASENDFIGTAKSLLPLYKVTSMDSTEYDYYIDELLKLLARYDSPAATQVIKSYLSANDKYLLKDVAFILLDKNEPVNPSVFTTIAADKNMRTLLYDNLKKKNKTSLFPPTYLTQQYFAESFVYTAASDDDEPSSYKFLTQKQGKYKGKTYNFYLYKVTYGEGDDAISHLGIAGGFNTNPKAVEPVDDISGIYWEEEFNQAELSNQLKAYLKQFNEAD